MSGGTSEELMALLERVLGPVENPMTWLGKHDRGPTISAPVSLHDLQSINPKNCQVLSKALVIQGVSNVLGLFQGIMANPDYPREMVPEN